MADLLSDSAVYKPTALGRRALQRADERASNPALRILARLNGYTELRRLVDLAPAEAATIGRVIPELYADRLIELVEQDSVDAGWTGRRGE